MTSAVSQEIYFLGDNKELLNFSEVNLMLIIHPDDNISVISYQLSVNSYQLTAISHI
ncbi:MAG: hypothetical protein F6K54_24155 [Okeania sp. SIO3B5]|uniref:hypothetical protein n=1 Tax=Okeania sp. SIO3B5 TaxID=2607811 RepID=UPI0014008843|nr:hypothetical protein [Okeania sp. SIO3B5]NEO55887.1 hypothetical protein [Okeania sp. SIO3B5]